MRKILLRTLLLCAMMVVLLVPAGASAADNTATLEKTKQPISGKSYTTTVEMNVHVPMITEYNKVNVNDFIQLKSATTNYPLRYTDSGYLRVEFAPLKGATVDSVEMEVKSGQTTTTIKLSSSSSSKKNGVTYYIYKNSKSFSGAITKVTINLNHRCSYNTTQIPAKYEGPTCTEDQKQINTCITCGYTLIEHTAKKATGHNWSYSETTKEATCTEAGEALYTCANDGCSESETRAVEVTGHDYTTTKEEKYLKTAATCTSGAVYYKSCSVCGAKGTEDDTFVSGDPIAHTWSGYVTTTQATCTEDGVKTRTCSVCQAQETEKIPATGHQYTDYVSNNDVTCTADGTKTATCDFCKTATNTVTDTGSVKAHQWNAGVVTKEPTEDETGVKTFTCTVCSTTRTEVIPVKEHTHAYTESVVKDNTLAQSATCTSAARYYKSCSCGDISRDATFASGSPLPHSFTNYVYDGNATCTADGTKTATCDSCGQAKDTVAADGTATGHLWDKGQVTTEPTVDHEGEMTYTCKNCPATKTETLAKLEPEKPNPVDPTPGTTDPTTPADPSKDKTAAGNQTLTASTDAAKNLEKQTETPRTSDDSALMLWTALLLLSGVSLTSAGLIRRCR